MRLCSIVLFSIAALFARDFSWEVDKFLGNPFRMHEYEAGNFHATLVDYPFDSAKDSVSSRVPKATILYIHGFNDYFFSRNLPRILIPQAIPFMQ